MTDVTLGAGGPPAAAPAGSLRRATVWMAAGTGLSRLTGVARVVALVYALGFRPLADAYNLANTAPNAIYDIVLGGVLSATFIPVFVDRLSTRGEDEAWSSISAICSLAVVVLVGATAVFFAAAPLIIDALTALAHPHGTVAAATLARERDVATSFLRWFVPQVLFYGLIALGTALLNTRRRFIAPAWVPIANNLVCIGVLVWFAVVVPHPSLLGVQTHPSQLVLLGLGTTLGVVAQALLLLPALVRTDLGGLRWHWNPADEGVRTVVRLGAWTFGFVVANQVALFFVLALAVGAPGPAPVSSYTYAYTFLQMPYAVVTFSVMAAVTPDLSAQWATGRTAAFVHRMATGLRAILAIIIPAAVGMLILARPAVALLPAHAGAGAGRTTTTGAALAMFSLGLPGFCTFLYVVRVLQSMQRTKVAFQLYLVENGLNVVLAVLLVGPLGVRGLALSLSVAYTAAAVLGLVVLRGWLGPLGQGGTWRPLAHVGVATAVMGVAVLFVSNLSAAESGPALWVRVGGSVLVGLAVFGATAAGLAARAARRAPPVGAGAPRR